MSIHLAPPISAVASFRETHRAKKSLPMRLPISRAIRNPYRQNNLHHYKIMSPPAGAKRFSEDATDVAWLDPGKDTSASSLPSVGQA